MIDLVRGVAGVRGCVGGAGTLHGADTLDMRDVIKRLVTANFTPPIVQHRARNLQLS